MPYKNYEDRIRRSREYREENREKIIAYERLRYSQDPEKSKRKVREWAEKNRDRRNAYCRYWAGKNKEKVRDSRKKSRELNRFSRVLSSSKSKANERGHSPCNATADEVRLAFNGKCHNPRCGTVEDCSESRLHMDHDHKTGDFRGWLCNSCNLTLGLLGDSEAKIRGLSGYLKRHYLTGFAG